MGFLSFVYFIYVKGRWSWGHKRSSGFSTTPCCQLLKSDFSKQMQIIPRFDDNTTCVTFCSQLNGVCFYTWGLEEFVSFLTQLQSAEWQKEQKKVKSCNTTFFMTSCPPTTILFFFYVAKMYISQQRHNSNKMKQRHKSKKWPQNKFWQCKKFTFFFICYTNRNLYTPFIPKQETWSFHTVNNYIKT